MERMRENPQVRQWWAMTDGFQEVRRSTTRLRVFPDSFVTIPPLATLSYYWISEHVGRDEFGTAPYLRLC